MRVKYTSVNTANGTGAAPFREDHEETAIIDGMFRPARSPTPSCREGTPAPATVVTW